jgi:hypothetical protein
MRQLVGRGSVLGESRLEEISPAQDAGTSLPGILVAESVEELLSGATYRAPMNKTSDSLSGSTFEQVVIDGSQYVVKHLHVDDDWVARATGDLRCRPLLVWRAGILRQLPRSIDHCIAAVAGGLGRGGLGAALLLRDASVDLLAEGDESMTLQQHEQFVQHMADLHVAFWGWKDTIGLQPLGNRLFELSPFTSDVEADLGGCDVVPPLIRPGWERLLNDAPFSGQLVWDLLADSSPLLEPISRGPQTFIHGDLKAGNLGCTPDGRTVLLDWAVPGQAPGLLDLTWYLAVNCDRIPESKEQTIDRYREALEHRGVQTADWWDEQLALALIFGFVQMGWSKQGAELAWWDARVRDAASFLQ